MENFCPWFAWCILAMCLGREFIGWMWWNNWEGDDDEPFPASLLRASWPGWVVLEKPFTRLCWRMQDVRRQLRTVLARRSSEEAPWEEPMDADGRTPTEWLFINMVGVWNLKNWYGGEYDWEVRKRWEEYLKDRGEPEEPVATEEIVRED